MEAHPVQERGADEVVEEEAQAKPAVGGEGEHVEQDAQHGDEDAQQRGQGADQPRPESTGSLSSCAEACASSALPCTWHTGPLE